METVNYKNGKLAWKFIQYPCLEESTGTLGVIEYGKELDFSIKRMFFLRNVEIGASRGFHAHEELQQFIICAQGSFTIRLDNGEKKYSYKLTPNSPGIRVDGKVWREMESFSSDSVMIVLCDREYRFDKVVRNYTDFKKNIERI